MPGGCLHSEEGVCARVRACVHACVRVCIHELMCTVNLRMCEFVFLSVSVCVCYMKQCW